MSKPAIQDEVVLRFRPLRDDVPWPHRVRALLKFALRACRLRCVRVEGLPTEEQEVGTEEGRAGE